jgi:plasmid stability protein
MATLIVRRLDDRVAARLKRRARLRGVSTEEEARRILTAAAATSRVEIAALAKAMRARQARNRSRAADLIREDRARRS